jgi:hypothetical protein
MTSRWDESAGHDLPVNLLLFSQNMREEGTKTNLHTFESTTNSLLYLRKYLGKRAAAAPAVVVVQHICRWWLLENFVGIWPEDGSNTLCSLRVMMR